MGSMSLISKKTSNTQTRPTVPPKCTFFLNLELSAIVSKLDVTISHREVRTQHSERSPLCPRRSLHHFMHYIPTSCWLNFVISTRAKKIQKIGFRSFFVLQNEIKNTKKRQKRAMKKIQQSTWGARFLPFFFRDRKGEKKKRAGKEECVILHKLYAQNKDHISLCPHSSNGFFLCCVLPWKCISH